MKSLIVITTNDYINDYTLVSSVAATKSNAVHGATRIGIVRHHGAQTDSNEDHVCHIGLKRRRGRYHTVVDERARFVTKVRVAISEAGGECVCWFPSAAQNAADSDSIKNRFYGHRILRYHYIFQLL